MKDLRVTDYVGTPSFLTTLIKKAEEMGFEFRRDFSLRGAVCSAEILPPSMRRTFEEDYGLKVADTYGSAILGILGYEYEEKSGFHVPMDLIIEIADPSTGKSLGPGEVGEAVKVRGMFIHSKQVEEVIQRFPEISTFQMFVSRSGHRDEWAISLELGEETDREKLSESLQSSIQESCRLRLDSIEFVSKGSIVEGAKKIVDQRTWE